ncbi:hypothetical protein DMK21_16065 [Salmonella enterica]|nr:hypothetical protein [Salmonella enterica]
MQVLPPGSTGGPSRLFILRPVATTLLMAAILLAGIIGYRFLPVAALPEVDYPTIQVVTLYPGASPDVMTSAVTAPLERQFGQMSGLKQMSSQSSGGASVVTLQFQLTLPLDVAEQEVQAAINAATNLLPSDLPNPPIYSKVNPADPPIMTLAVTSNAMPMTQVEDMVETRVAQKISQVSGVGLVTLAVAILISAVVSLTLTPMMCARMLSQQSLRKQNRFSRACERVFDRVIASYGRGLAKVLNHPWLTLSVAFATLLLSVMLWIVIPKGFFPVQDNGIIQGTLQAPQSSSYASMAQRQRQVAERLLQDPAVQSLTTFVGVDGANPTLNSARLQINLKPLDARDDRVQQVISRLQTAVATIPGVALYLQATQDLTIDTQVSRTQFQFTLQATTLDALSHWGPKLLNALQSLPQLSEVSSDWQDRGLAARVNVDRDSASRLGISMADVDNALYNAFGQRLISTIYTQANQYRVVLEHNTASTPGLAALETIRLTSRDGGTVPLSAIASIEQRFAPLSINHLDQFPVTTFSFNVPEGYSLGDAVQAILDTEKTLALPADITTQFQGSTLAFQAALGSTVWLIVAAVVAMYIVLGVLYESFIHPITILSTLPTAGVGALLALIIAGSALDIIAIIGIILLIGIVKKNAIMMIDFALAAEREQGMSPRDAIFQACLLRFRPILMTTLAALLGALPLMLSTGVGAELRRPLGIAMVGGLLVSQVLTLFTTPVIYLLFDRLSLYVKSRFPRHKEEA